MNELGREVYRAILDGIREPIVFADTQHIIRYMNEAAAKQYEKRGGYELIGRSLMDCHKPSSVKKIEEAFARLRDEGLDEVELYRRPRKIAFMKAVRDESGQLLGYYERYETLK
jgi:PAS domain S-box-containing protein